MTSILSRQREWAFRLIVVELFLSLAEAMYRNRGGQEL